MSLGKIPLVGSLRHFLSMPMLLICGYDRCASVRLYLWFLYVRHYTQCILNGLFLAVKRPRAKVAWWMGCFVLCSLFVSAKAQTYSVTGHLIDSLHQPISTCTVALWRSADTTLVSALQSDAKGYFNFSQLPPADYFLQIGDMRYQKQIIPLQLRQNMVLGPIILQEQVRTLEGVVVSYKRKLIQLQSDKIRYHVADDPRSKNLSLYEVLQRMPLISSTGGGFVIKGRSAPTFYVNGMPSALLNSNPKEALKAMRAAHVKEIQLITEPGARYEGEFTGGIINIVTTQRFESLLTASIGATVNTRHQWSNSAEVGVQLGNLSLRGNIAYSKQSDYNERWTLSRTMPSKLDYYRFEQEKARHYYRNNSLIASALLSWQPNTQDLWNVAFDYMNLDTRGNGLQKQVMYTKQGDVNYQYDVKEHSQTRYRSINFSSNYQHKWNDQSYAWLMYQYSELPKWLDDLYILEHTQDYKGNNQHLIQYVNSKEHTLQADVSYALSESHKLNGGAKGVLRVNSNNSQLQTQSPDESWQQKFDIGDLFKHKQFVSGLYAEYQYKSGSWDVKLGLRNEWTAERVVYPLQTAENFQTSYLNWLPSFRVTYAFSSSNTLSLYYRSNIARPSIQYLNPRSTLQDLSSITYGNPHLQSEKYHKCGLDWTYTQGNLMLNLSGTYRYCPNSIEVNVGVQPNGVMYRTFNNNGRHREIGVGVYTAYTFNEMLSMSCDGNLAYLNFYGQLEGLPASNHGLAGNVSLSLNLNLPKEYYFSLNGGYNFPSVGLTGTGFNFYYSQASLSKSFFANRLNLSLSANDFLWRNKSYRRTLHTPSFESVATYQNYGCLVELGITYRFNTKEIKLRKTSKRIHNNDVKELKVE